VRLNLLIEIAGSPWSVGRGGNKVANALSKYDLAMDKPFISNCMNNEKNKKSFNPL